MSSPGARTEVLVIGGGPGGYHAAIRASQLGKSVTIVDEGTFGGVCLHRGCIPSKGLIGLGKMVENVQGAEAMGLHVKGVEVDLAATQTWKKRQIETLAKGTQSLLKARDVEIVVGRAVFTGPDTVQVGDQTIGFDHCIVATGSKSVELPHLRFDGDRIIGSRHALELTEVPPSLLVVGGGFIGLELGQLYRQLGSEVTVAEMLPRILPTADKDLSAGIERALKGRGMTIKTKTKVTAATPKGDGLDVTLEAEDGSTETVHVAKVLVAVGRRANTEGLALDKAGVETDRGVIKVDGSLRTSNPKILAIGDAVPGPALAHKASHEGLVAAEVVAGKDTPVDYRAIPWFCYTTPEVAAVGLTEEEARAEYGDGVKVGKFQFSILGKARMSGHTEGFVKAILSPDDVVIGAHILGEHAAILIAEPALAIEMGATGEDIAWTIHAHPSLSEAFLEAVEVAHGRAIHVPK